MRSLWSHQALPSSLRESWIRNPLDAYTCVRTSAFYWSLCWPGEAEVLWPGESYPLLTVHSFRGFYFNWTRSTGLNLLTLSRYKAATMTGPFVFPTIPVHLLSHYTSRVRLTWMESLRAKTTARLRSILASYTLTVVLRNVAGNFKQKVQQQKNL
jgi:hypothetical protein